MMHEWLEWARGPLFRFAILFMFLGLARLVILNLVGIYDAMRRAGNKDVPTRQVLAYSLGWMMPFGKVPNRKAWVTVVSMVFHVAIIVVPVFLGAHILLWERGLGVGWPALAASVADILTLLGIATGVLLLWHRVFARTARALSRVQDYVFLLLLVAVFASGYLAMHPHLNPFSYDSTMFVHVVAGNGILIFLPFSKLSHAILFPLNQLVSEIGWHLVPGAGDKVAVSLGKENEPV